MCEAPQPVRIRVPFTHNRVRRGVVGHNNDAATKTARHELVDVCVGDFACVACNAAGPRGHRYVQITNARKVGKCCGADDYREMGQGVLGMGVGRCGGAWLRVGARCRRPFTA